MLNTAPPCLCGHSYQAHSRLYAYCVACDRDPRRPFGQQCWKYAPGPESATPPTEETTMPLRLTDLLQPADEVFPTLEAAMAAVLARYPQAVFSDVEWSESTIWVWASNAASQSADPAAAVAWIRQET